LNFPFIWKLHTPTIYVVCLPARALKRTLWRWNGNPLFRCNFLYCDSSCFQASNKPTVAETCTIILKKCSISWFVLLKSFFSFQINLINILTSRRVETENFSVDLANTKTLQLAVKIYLTTSTCAEWRQRKLQLSVCGCYM